ncbi:sigma factor [Nonomuraea fuscirosea]|uniref:sigma factor n=1 Tax=Nonomuraea fuscirosea TaxID=1291556 RepID=UPI00343A9088
MVDDVGGGGSGEAEDAVQEAWARVSRADTSQVENPAGWLTTVVARVCLNLLELLDPDVVASELRGADAVASFFSGRAEAGRLALVDGVPAAVWAHRDRPKAVFSFTVADAKITSITVDTDPDRIRGHDIVLLGGAKDDQPDQGSLRER